MGTHSQTVGLFDKLKNHVADLALNVMGLVAHSNLGQTRQVNKGKVKYMRGKDLERYRNVADAFIGPRHTVRLILRSVTCIRTRIIGYIHVGEYVILVQYSSSNHVY